MLLKNIVFSLLLFFSLKSMAQLPTIIEDTTTVYFYKLDKFVVKASKNNSTLKELPLSLSILQSRSIEQNGINSLKQVSTLTPNLNMPDYGSKLTSPIYIRGIGSRINSPSVGLYVDNVPVFEKNSFAFDLFDIERIEVLRGPQGTLYGRNSMGGLINVVSKSPLNYQGIHLGVSAASYGLFKINGGIYKKLNDKFAFSVSANYQHLNGYFTNEFNDEKVDNLNSIGLKNRLIFKLSNNLTLSNTINVEGSKQGGYPYAVYIDSLKSTGSVNYNQPSTYNRNLLSDAFMLNFSKENWELTNTTSYQLLDGAQNIDQDFSPDSLYFVNQTQNEQMFANELIFKSKGKKKLNWLFGAFAFHQDKDSEVGVDLYFAKTNYTKSYQNDVLGLALFHQSTYNLTDNLSATFGLRYDNESAKLHYGYTGTRAGGELPEIDTIYEKIGDEILLPKFALNYKFDKASVYASYTTGYKAGGFNTTFETPDQLSFKNEKSDNYEIGMKGSLFQDFLYSDFAIFYTKLNNQQIYRSVPSGRGAYLDNAGLSENKGFEVTMRNRIFHGFEGMVSYGYTDSKILEYVKDSTTNYNGNFTPYIPRHTLAIQLSKTISLRNFDLIDKMNFNILLKQNGLQYWTLDNQYNEESYSILNARLSLLKGDFKVDFWGKNILNTEYNSFLFQALGNTFAQTGKPAQIGISLSMKL